MILDHTETVLTLFRYTDIIIVANEIGGDCMIIEELIKRKNMTKYRLAVDADIPHATLSDICSGKTNLLKCSSETVYKLAKALDVTMEWLTEAAMRELERERAYEYGLPPYLQQDLDAYKQGLKNASSLLDCLWGELYGSINIAKDYKRGGQE